MENPPKTPLKSRSENGGRESFSPQTGMISPENPAVLFAKTKTQCIPC